MRVVSALMVQDRLASAKRHLERIFPFVDTAVVVDNGSIDGTREWLLSQPKVIPVFRAWNDSFVEGRNAYLRAIDRYAEEAGEEVVICVADDDELYSDALLGGLRKITQSMYEEDINVLRVRSQSVETDWKGDVHWSRLDDWHKPLLLLWESGIRYVGIGKSEVHEDLRIPSGRRETILPDQGGVYRYDHVKKHGEIWLRGIRNFFAGGGGPNLGELNPLWRPFRELIAGLSGVGNAADFVKYLQQGDVDQRVLDWFVEHRFLGTQFDPTPAMWPRWPDGTSEVREGFLAFFLYLHPERMPLELIDADRNYLDYRQEAKVVWGPNAPAWAN